MSIGKLIGQGRTGEIYEWDKDKVLKLFFEGYPKTVVEYEYNISQKMVENKLPAPKVYDLIRQENRYGIVYERVNGITMTKYIATKPWKVLRCAKMLAELHLSIQKAVDYDLPSFKDKLLERIEEIDLVEASIKERLKEYIRGLPGGNLLCHGDFHPDNILITNDKNFIIDWVTVAKGNQLSEVARTMVILEFAALPEQVAYFEKIMIGFIRKLFAKGYLKHYLRKTGVSLKEIRKWELPLVAVRLTEYPPQAEKDFLLRYLKENIESIC